jgi:hypothetical protein
VSADTGGSFVPVAIVDTGEVFLMRINDNKQRAFTVMGMMASMRKFQYVVYVMDVRIRAATDEERKLVDEGRGAELTSGTFPEDSEEALNFLVVPFSKDIKGATGLWKYARLGGCIGWASPAPHFEPKVWTESGFYKWTMDGYNAAETMGLRPAKGR